MGAPLVLAYDVGTSGVKAVVVDGHGRVLGSSLQSYRVDTPRPGWVEQDGEAILAALGLASRAVLASLAIDPGDVAGVGVTAQMFCVVPVDGAGRALRPMLSWLDQRARSEAEAIAAGAGADGGYAIFDAVLTAKDIVPRIVWLRAHERWAVGRTAWYLDCKEAIVARLTGQVATDPAGASAFRLVDRATGDWAEEACRVAGVPRARLPRILPAAAVVGRLTREAASLTGLRAGTPVVVGAGDVPASQIGAGATGPGDVHLSLGTAVYFGITSSEHLVDPARKLGPLRHAVPGEWILWLEVATGGAALSWLDRLLAGLGRLEGDRDFGAVDRAVEAAEGEMEGLVFAPWLTGERVPLFDDALRAAFVGLGLHHGPAHLYRAVMEGVASQIAWAFDYGRAFGIEPAAIRAVGGGSISSAWTRIIAASLGRRLEIVAEPQTVGARGAAACALVGVGLAADLRSAVPAQVDRTVEATTSEVRRARDRLGQLQALYPALRTVRPTAPARAGRRPSAVRRRGRGETAE
jgi:xylulokinase